MVDNRKRKTKYQDLSFTKQAVKEFVDCAIKGESRSETLQRICRYYKNNCKCTGLSDQCVTIAEQ